jgi:hypothetical protein
MGWLSNKCYDVLCMTASDAIFDRLLEPLTSFLTPEGAQKLVEFRADPQTQQRVEDLAIKCNEGILTPAEEDEYDAYISVANFIAILQAKARARLPRHPAA